MERQRPANTTAIRFRCAQHQARQNFLWQMRCLDVKQQAMDWTFAFKRFRLPRSRAEALGFIGGGFALAALSWGLIAFAVSGGSQLDSVAISGLKKIMVFPMLLVPVGLCAMYFGLARLAFGERLDSLDIHKVDATGLLFVLGFAAVLLLAGYILFVRFHFSLPGFDW
jgi:hypothetical protein